RNPPHHPAAPSRRTGGTAFSPSGPGPAGARHRCGPHRICRGAVPDASVPRDGGAGGVGGFQQLVLAPSEYWSRHGAVVQQPYDLEVGAGTMHPDTFFRVLGPEPWRAAYCSPSRRPVDGRYGENPFRVYRHYQFQVILKPSPPDVQELYLASLQSF